jgi:hypothetical protein
MFGGMSISAGYYGTSLILDGYLGSNYLFLAFLFLLIGFGSASTYHCSLATNYRNWSEQYRSVAVGLTVSFFGLSAFVFSQIATKWFISEDQLQVSTFLKFVALACLLLNIFAMFFLKAKQVIESPYISIEAEEQVPLFQEVYEHEIAEYTEDQEEQERLGIGNDFSAQIEIERQLSVDMAHPVDIAHEPSVGIMLEEISCFRSIDAYILALNMFVLVGAGLMYINNVGNIGISN